MRLTTSMVYYLPGANARLFVGIATSQRYKQRTPKRIFKNIPSQTEGSLFKMTLPKGKQDSQYKCDQCEYVTAQKGHLNVHVKNVHKGIK